jgi:hypothetical protein
MYFVLHGNLCWCRLLFQGVGILRAIHSLGVLVLVTMVSVLVGCASSHHRTILGKDGKVFVKVSTTQQKALVETHERPAQVGLPTRVLRINGRAVLFEFDRNQDGKVDDIRLRLSDGRWISLTDVNRDGVFHSRADEDSSKMPETDD